MLLQPDSLSQASNDLTSWKMVDPLFLPSRGGGGESTTHCTLIWCVVPHTLNVAKWIDRVSLRPFVPATPWERGRVRGRVNHTLEIKMAQQLDSRCCLLSVLTVSVPPLMDIRTDGLRTTLNGCPH